MTVPWCVSARLKLGLSSLLGRWPTGPHRPGSVHNVKLSVVAQAGVTVLKHPGGQLRLMPWQASTRVAYLASITDQPNVPREFIEEAISLLQNQGFDSVVTGAISNQHETSFFETGFTEKERLVLLHQRVHGQSGRRQHANRLRRPHRIRRRHVNAVLQVDSRCFDSFWRLDDSGINEALAATVRTRFRFYAHQGAVASYAISGFTGQSGFIQRLAVDPAAQHQGLGAGLLDDALRWMARRGVRDVYVNTQTTNKSALALYRRMGFAPTADYLAVLERDLGI